MIDFSVMRVFLFKPLLSLIFILKDKLIIGGDKYEHRITHPNL